MSEKVVDARGQVCPKPLIMTKKALNDLARGEQLRILIDNDTSKSNVERFLTDNGIDFLTLSENGVHAITLNAAPDQLAHPNAESYCTTGVSEPAPRQPHAIAITNDKMGNGPEELGRLLIKAFVNTLREVDPLPGAIVLYTNGVLLAIEGSPVLESLQELERKNVKILVCGTCADYFQIKSRIKVGIISNMYTILETLSRAGHVIAP